MEEVFFEIEKEQSQVKFIINKQEQYEILIENFPIEEFVEFIKIRFSFIKYYGFESYKILCERNWFKKTFHDAMWMFVHERLKPPFTIRPLKIIKNE